jgi:hypothetical protein
MQRKLLILGLLVCSLGTSFAQKKKNNDAAASGRLSIPGTAFLYPVPEVSDKKGVDFKAENAPLPAFKVINYKGENTTKEILNGSNLLVMMFNPTCDHCEETTEMLKKNIFRFKKTKILMVSGSMMVPLLSYFEANMHTSEFPTFTVSVDSAQFIEKAFNYVALPQINIYSGKDLRLLKTFNGTVSIDSLQSFIE